MMATVHTYPVADLIEHDTESDDCLCGPTTEPIPRNDGSMGWHILHHSLDGREANEMTHNEQTIHADATCYRCGGPATPGIETHDGEPVCRKCLRELKEARR